jgi:uncharacterized protein (TIGR03086 family)
VAVHLPEVHAAALEVTGAFVGAVPADRWHAPTPCAGWDVRALVNHVVAGNWWAAELAAGRTIPEVGDRLDGDVLGDDPSGAYRASAAAAAEVFRRPGAMERPCAVSYGPVPGSVYCGHRFIDVLVHGWDLAVAVGADPTLPAGLVEACLEVVTPQAELFAGSGMFGTARPVPPDAPAQTRLLALLGRDG